MNATLFAEIEVKRNELSELILHFESLTKEEINLPYNELLKEQTEVDAQIKAIEDQLHKKWATRLVSKFSISESTRQDILKLS